eukprot:Opistho-1_new@58126
MRAHVRRLERVSEVRQKASDGVSVVLGRLRKHARDRRRPWPNGAVERACFGTQGRREGLAVHDRSLEGLEPARDVVLKRRHERALAIARCGVRERRGVERSRPFFGCTQLGHVIHEARVDAAPSHAAVGRSCGGRKGGKGRRGCVGCAVCEGIVSRVRVCDRVRWGGPRELDQRGRLGAFCERTVKVPFDCAAAPEDKPAATIRRLPGEVALEHRSIRESVPREAVYAPVVVGPLQYGAIRVEHDPRTVPLIVHEHPQEFGPRFDVVDDSEAVPLVVPPCTNIPRPRRAVEHAVSGPHAALPVAIVERAVGKPASAKAVELVRLPRPVIPLRGRLEVSVALPHAVPESALVHIFVGKRQDAEAVRARLDPLPNVRRVLERCVCLEYIAAVSRDNVDSFLRRRPPPPRPVKRTVRRVHYKRDAAVPAGCCVCVSARAKILKRPAKTGLRGVCCAEGGGRVHRVANGAVDRTKPPHLPLLVPRAQRHRFLWACDNEGVPHAASVSHVRRPHEAQVVQGRRPHRPCAQVLHVHKHVAEQEKRVRRQRSRQHPPAAQCEPRRPRSPQ